jgi:hypothetical protein
MDDLGRVEEVKSTDGSHGWGRAATSAAEILACGSFSSSSVMVHVLIVVVEVCLRGAQCGAELKF